MEADISQPSEEGVDDNKSKSFPSAAMQKIQENWQKITIYGIMQNQRRQSIVNIIIFIIIFLVIIDQIYALTEFAYKYSKYYDYGKLMQGMCMDNYIEYETARFHVSNNILDIKLKNDNFSTRYDWVILVVSLVVTLYISWMFGFNFIQYTNFVDFPNMKMIPLYILYAYILFIIPITFVVYLSTDKQVDISPFQIKPENWATHSFIGLLLILIAIFFKKAIMHIVFRNVNEPLNTSKISKFTLLFLLIMSIVAYYFLVLAMNNFIDNRKQFSEYEKDSTEDADKYHKQFIQNYSSIDYIDNESQSSTNALEGFFMKIFSKIFPSITAKNIQLLIGVLFTVLGIFVIWFVLWCLGNFEFMKKFVNPEDTDILLYFGLYPMLAWFVIILVIFATKSYNTFVNKNMLFTPNKMYKEDIANINNIFNKLLNNDYATVTNDSICKNTANAIHMALYSTLFLHTEQNVITKLPITPKLIYVYKCGVSEYIPYDKIPEYNLRTYLKTDVFYNDNKCSSLNNKLISMIMQNVIPIYEIKLTETDKANFANTFKTKLKYAIYYIQKGQTYDGNRKLEFSENFTNNNLIVPIIIPENVQEYKPYNDILQNITNEYIAYINTMYDYTIKTIQALCKCNAIKDVTLDNRVNMIKKLDNQVLNNNQKYSVNIKKDYIETYIDITAQLFDRVNKLMAINKKNLGEDGNHKLSKLIIKNYNTFQEDKADKYYSYNNELLTNPLSKDDTNRFDENVENSLMYTTKVNIEQIYKYTSNVYINLKSNDASADLVTFNNTSNIIYSSNMIYNKENKESNNSLYEYRKTYLNDNMHNINNAAQDFEKIKSLSLDIKNSTIDKELQSFMQEYGRIEKKYYKQYDILYANIHDDTNINDVDIKEAKDAQSIAAGTSTSVYGLIVLYMVSIILANFVK